MECSRCSEKQDQQTADEAQVSGTAADVWVCLKCQDRVCERCEMPASARRELHHRCDDNPYAQTCRSPDCDAYECSNCRDNRSEAAYESSLSDYYGGSTPQTLDEQHCAAWRTKEGLS